MFKRFLATSIITVSLEKYFDRIYRNMEDYFIIPVLMVVLALTVLGGNYILTGQVLTLGLDFTGGTEMQFSIDEEFSTQEIESAFANAGREDVEALEQVTTDETYLLLRAPPPELTEGEAVEVLEDEGFGVELQSLSTIDATVSEEFFRQAILAFGIAFIIMSTVVFIAFRDIVPSFAVIFAIAGDITFAMAGMALLDIPLTLGSLAALLMLIGYSVDTDIVLSTRVLKQRRGSLRDRVWSATKTGLTMSSGGIAGFTLLYAVSWMIAGPSELSNIAAVMVIGLLADMPLTWLGNAVVLKKYADGDMETASEAASELGGMLTWR